MKLSLLLLLLSLFTISYCLTNTRSQDPLNPNFLSLNQDPTVSEPETSVHEQIPSEVNDDPVSKTFGNQSNEDEASDSDAPEEVEEIHKENNEETNEETDEDTDEEVVKENNEETDEETNEDTDEEAVEENKEETHEEASEKEETEEIHEEEEETEKNHEEEETEEIHEEEETEKNHEEEETEQIHEEEETEEIHEEEENNEETNEENDVETEEEVSEEAGASEPVNPAPASVWTKDATVGKNGVAEEGWELLDAETIRNSAVIQRYLKAGSDQAIAAALREGKILNDYYFVRRINRVERQNLVNANNEVIQSTYKYDLDLSNGKGTNVAVKFEVEYNEAMKEGEISHLEYHPKVL